VAGAEPAERRLHLHRLEAVAEELRALAAGGLVAGHEQHRAAPGAAQRGVDPGLPHLAPVEVEAVPLGAGHGVAHLAVARARHRVHADEERRVAAVLERTGVLRPLALDDELAAVVEQVGPQRVERLVAAGAVAVHHHDLGRTAGPRAADGGVDLLGVEGAAFLVQRIARPDPAPVRDAGDALHVADDEHAHGRQL
jgi:hypothetical protein